MTIRKTRIIATVGPATESPEVLRQLIDAGVNIFRINMSHATHDWLDKTVQTIRSAAKDSGHAIGILMDTQGPAIRTGDLPVKLELEVGQRFSLTVRGEESEEVHSVDVNYENFVNDIKVGDIVLVDNGEIHMKVLAKHEHKVDCEVLTPGTLGSRRHINLPGVKVRLPALTDKDLADIEAGLKAGIDFVALSFVRKAKDLEDLRKALEGHKHQPRIIAKVEDQEALENLDDIIQHTDALMIARGDLGIECPYEELPIIQRRIVKACQLVGCPVIVATHMLESMIDTPMPTRAEVTDVANAVYEQADAIMLSGETTVGKYPVKCIEVFDRIARRIEHSGGAGFYRGADLTSPRQKLVKSAVTLANELKAHAIMVFTERGHMARYAAWMRPHYSRIIAVCERWEIADSIVLNWGVVPHVTSFDHGDPEGNINRAVAELIENGSLESGDSLVIVGAIAAEDRIVNAVQMRQID